MSRHRFDNGLTADDTRIVAEGERDLQQLLSVQPSADFVARVRTRIERERVRPMWSLRSWRLGLAAGALAVAALAIVLALRPKPTAVPPSAPIVAQVPPQPPMVTPDTPRRPDREAVLAPVEEMASRRQPRSLAVVRPPSKSEPEVLVPPDQRIALERAMALFLSGELDGSVFPTLTRLPKEIGDDPSAPPQIVVEDVVVPPIGVPSGGIEK